MPSTFYGTVMCVETDQLIELPADADTAGMRSTGTYLHVSDEPEFVTPCGGAGTMVKAYWRGDRGNRVRAQELDRQSYANSHHSV